MAQRESRVSRQIQNALRAEGWFCFKVHGSEYMMAGLPDIIVCAEGFFFGLETKHDETRGHVSARQARVHQLIREAGGVAEVVTSPAEAIAVIRKRLKKARLGHAGPRAGL